MHLADLVAASRAVTESSGRLAKIGHLTSLLRRVPPDEIEITIAFLSGAPRQGRIGIGGAVLADPRAVPAAASATRELREVDATFERIARVTGARSGAERASLLRDLLRRA